MRNNHIIPSNEEILQIIRKYIKSTRSKMYFDVKYLSFSISTLCEPEDYKKLKRWLDNK